MRTTYANIVETSRYVCDYVIAKIYYDRPINRRAVNSLVVAHPFREHIANSKKADWKETHESSGGYECSQPGKFLNTQHKFCEDFDIFEGNVGKQIYTVSFERHL